ncbi:MAG: glycosyltransferase [Chloroflexi bacterium]|nr:glycosyltransferase [Chloroflexota bacterium]
MIASIVIRAKNEARDIGTSLTQVFAQQGVPSFEVIVVDSGSTDATLDIARQFPTRIIQIPPETFTYGRALNIGVQAATGDFAVSLAAHALPSHHRWLANLLAPFADPTIGGVYGRELPRANVTLFELFGMWLSGVTSTRPRRQERDMMFSNRNGAFRRGLVLEHPFDEQIPGAEDLAWADWIQRHGWAVYYEPTAPVYHSHGESLPRLLRRMANDQPTIIGLKLGILARRRAAAAGLSAKLSVKH